MKKRNQMKIFSYLQFVIFGLISFVPTLAMPDSLLAQSSRPQETNSEINALEAIRIADDKLVTLPENLPLRIPLCSTSPLKYYGDSGASDKYSCDPNKKIAIGYISPLGKGVIPITPSNLRPMFQAGTRNGGSLSSFKDNLKLSSRIPVIDLLVVDETEQKEIIYNVNVYSFMRDCLNATLNGTLYKFN